MITLDNQISIVTSKKYICSTKGSDVFSLPSHSSQVSMKPFLSDFEEEAIVFSFFSSFDSQLVERMLKYGITISPINKASFDTFIVMIFTFKLNRLT